MQKTSQVAGINDLDTSLLHSRHAKRYNPLVEPEDTDAPSQPGFIVAAYGLPNDTIPHSKTRNKAS